MADTNQPVKPIARGYARSYEVRVAPGGEPLFPAGCALRAQVREYPGASAVLATLGTAAGSIVRIDDYAVEVRFAEADTAAMPAGTVWMDFARTDIDPDDWIDLQLGLPVIEPVTKP